MRVVFSARDWRSYVAFTFAVIHLSIISFFAFLSDTETKLAFHTGLLRALTESIVFYSNWSGTGTAYSYFAPKVAEIPRTRFQIVYVSGDVSEYILGVQQFEIELRVAALTRSALFPNARPLFARSLAATAFSQHPDAQRVTVVFEDNIFPNFEEAIEGETAFWSPTYSAEFVKEGDEMVCRC